MRPAIGLIAAGLLLSACAASESGDQGITLAAPILETLTPSPSVSPSRTPSPVPALAPSPTQPRCGDQAGRVLETQYPGSMVAGEIPLLIYTPPCYLAIEWSYPTLYLLHGYPFDERQWLDLGLVELMDRRIASGHAVPILVIMPRLPEPLFRSTDGGPGSYEDEFISNLLPYIDENFPTQGNANARVLGGLSRGGIWALEIGLRHPELFSTVAAISPALAVNYSRPAYDPFQLILSGGPFPALTLLLAGEDDWALKETLRLNELMGKAGMVSELIVTPGGHEAATWSASLKLILDRLPIIRPMHEG